MSKITFHVELDNRVKKDGTQNIQIRITQSGKLRRVAVGFSVEVKYWNEEKKEVRKTHPLANEINMTIEAKKVELQRMYLKAKLTKQPINPTTLQKKLRKELVGDSFLGYFQQRIMRINNPRTKRASGSVFNKLVEFLRNTDLFFDEIDYKWLKDYESYLRHLGNGANTIHNNIKTIKAAYNEAIKEGVYEPNHVSPFSQFKAKTEKVHRVRLSKEEISELESLSLEGLENDARNIFLFSYYCQGVRISDALCLKWSNIVNDERIEYKAAKTKKIKNLKLIPRAKDILKVYEKPKQKANDYIFPFLKNKNPKDFTPDEWVRKLESATALINKYLNRIAPKIGLRKLSTHSSRHSFADIAHKKTGDIYAVSAALGHGSVAVTTAYLNEISKQENDSLVDKTFDL
jgi:integrase